MSAYHVHRSIIIEKTQQEVFEYVSNYHTWTTWSPWLCTEKTAEVAISGTGNEEKDIYAWKGKLVGEGEIEHMTLTAPNLIDQDIRFVKPFKSKAHVWWNIEEAKNGTKVTWNMEGSLPFFLFFMKKQMVAWIGGDYERGLKMIKEVLETGEILSDTKIEGIVGTEETHYIARQTECTMAEIGEKMQEDFIALSKSGIAPNDAPFSIYYDFDFVKQNCVYRSCFPTKNMEEKEEFITDTLPASRAVKVVHSGSYENLGNSWMAGYSYIQNTKGIKVDKKKKSFEVYMNDPYATAPKDLVTEIYIPIR